MSRKLLIVFKGLPATGKSTLAKKLREVFQCELLNRDDIKQQLLTEGFTEGSDPQQLGFKSYQLMWQQAREYVAKDGSCICDTSLNQSQALESLRAIKQETEATIVIIECVCRDPNVLQARLESRSNEYDFPKYTNSWQKFLAYKASEFNQGDYAIPYPVLTVDTAKTVDLTTIVQWIEQQ